MQEQVKNRGCDEAENQEYGALQNVLDGNRTNSRYKDNEGDRVEREVHTPERESDILWDKPSQQILDH